MEVSPSLSRKWVRYPHLTTLCYALFVYEGGGGIPVPFKEVAQASPSHYKYTVLYSLLLCKDGGCITISFKEVGWASASHQTIRGPLLEGGGGILTSFRRVG